MSLKFLVLGLLDLHPMTGYDLKHAFDDTSAHFWAADQAQIYRTLAGLVDEGAVEVTVVAQQRRPDRREHRITDGGRDALSTWLRSPIEPERSREPFLARMFLVGREDPAVARRLLAERRHLAAERLVVLTAIPQRTAGTLAERLRTATLRHGIRQLEAELAWIDETTAAL